VSGLTEEGLDPKKHPEGSFCGGWTQTELFWPGGARLWAAEPDPRIKQILAKTITVDMHNHGGIGSNTPPQPSNSVPKSTPKAGREIGPSGRDANIVEAMRRAGDSTICLTYASDGKLMGLGAGASAPGTRSNLIPRSKPGRNVPGAPQIRRPN
jgi:hypothetical protein